MIDEVFVGSGRWGREKRIDLGGRSFVCDNEACEPMYIESGASYSGAAAPLIGEDRTLTLRSLVRGTYQVELTVTDPATGQAPGANSDSPDSDGDMVPDYRDVDSDDPFDMGPFDIDDAGLEGLTCILGAKIDNIYDMIDFEGQAG